MASPPEHSPLALGPSGLRVDPGEVVGLPATSGIAVTLGPLGPEAYAFPNVRGGRISRRRVAKIVGEATTLASERLVGRGLPPLPRATPHTMRRTYISIALLANNFDVLWVMGQVGREDSMTMDVYAQAAVARQARARPRVRPARAQSAQAAQRRREEGHVSRFAAK